jgi:hypothetical protein
VRGGSLSGHPGLQELPGSVAGLLCSALQLQLARRTDSEGVLILGPGMARRYRMYGRRSRALITSALTGCPSPTSRSRNLRERAG